MNRINQNNNLEALKVNLNTSQTKKNKKEEKQETVKEIKEFETKKVEASALEAIAAQNWGAQLSKVDISDAATEKRLEKAFTNSAFMKKLNELQGFEKDFDFVKFAFTNIHGVNQEKLAKYLEKPLHQETINSTINSFKQISF